MNENEELFKENARLQRNRHNAKKKVENEEQFKEKLRSQRNRLNAKKRVENEEEFKEKNRLQNLNEHSSWKWQGNFEMIKCIWTWNNIPIKVPKMGS